MSSFEFGVGQGKLHKHDDYAVEAYEENAGPLFLNYGVGLGGVQAFWN